MHTPTLSRPAHTLVSGLLLTTFLLSPAVAAGPKAAGSRGPILVALYAGAGVSGKGPKVLEETLQARGEFKVTPITPEEIRAGKLKGFQALIVPGGLSSTQGIALGADGRDMVRQFISGGGAYVGICAGCYLASCHYQWSLHVLPVTVVDSANWQRGVTTLPMRLTDEGKQWLSCPAAEVKVKYHNGPVLAPVAGAKEPLLPLATYLREVTRKGAKEGLMVNTPAIAAARYGKGWVVGISPHPEQSEGLTDMVPAALRWAAANRQRPTTSKSTGTLPRVACE
jgi:hypothetical protein